MEKRLMREDEILREIICESWEKRDRQRKERAEYNEKQYKACVRAFKSMASDIFSLKEVRMHLATAYGLITGKMERDFDEIRQ